jgi:hypothetical protein
MLTVLEFKGCFSNGDFVIMVDGNPKLLQFAFYMKSALFNLVFICYVWLIQPMLMDLLTASQDGSGNFWLGWMLFFVPILEIIGIFIKIPVSNYFRSQHPQTENRNNPMIFLFIINMVLHLGMGCLYMFMCFQIIQGVALADGSDFYAILAIILMFIVIVKEAFVIVFIMGATDLPGNHKPAKNKFDQWLFGILSKKPISGLSWGDFLLDLAGDGFLFLFTAISFTVMWNFIVALNPPDIHSSDMIMELLGVLLYFMMVYLPLRASSFPFEMNTVQNKTQWYLYYLSIVAAAIFSVFPLVV